MISAHESFRGTLTQTSVYPREIVKQGLTFNAAAVIFAHNHPSGIAEPSHADRLLTSRLKYKATKGRKPGFFDWLSCLSWMSLDKLMVEWRRIELPTSALRTRRSPS